MKKTKDAIWPGETVEIEASATSETAVLQVISGELTADKAIALVKKEFGNLIIDCSTPAGFADAMKTRSMLIKMRTSADKKRRELDAPDQERIKARMAAYKLLEPVLLQLEAPIDRSIKAQQEIDKENARIATEQEKARVDGIRARIDRIKALLPGSVSLTAAALEARILQIEGAQIGVEFAEFAEEATTVKAEIVVGLKEMLVTKQEQEAEMERVKLRERIAAIRDWPRLVFGKTSAEIEMDLAGYLDIEFPSFGELQDEADAAREDSITQVMTIMEETKQREDDAAELARLRAAQPPKVYEPLTAERATADQSKPIPAQEPIKVELVKEPVAVVESANDLWAHVAAYATANGYDTERSTLVEIICEAERVWRGNESPRRWWNDCFTVVKVDGRLIGFNDAITTGDDTPYEKGWEFDPESICDVVAKEITLTIYERAQ